MKIKNVALIKPVKMYDLVDREEYLNEQGIIAVEFENDTRRYLDLASNRDITDYKEWSIRITDDSEMKYIFKGVEE